MGTPMPKTGHKQKAPTLNRPRKLGFLPHWRKMTWLFNAVFFAGLIYIIAAGASDQSPKAKDCQGLSTHDCHALASADKSIGIAALVVMWVMAIVVVGILWLVTRYSRHCPRCGSGVKRGAVLCPNSRCNYDFLAATMQHQYQPQPYPPAPHGYPPAVS